MTLETAEEREKRIAEMAARGGVPAVIRQPATEDEIADARARGLADVAADAKLGPFERGVRWQERELSAVRVSIAEVLDALDVGGETRPLLRRLRRLRERELLALRETGRLAEYMERAPERLARKLRRGLEAIARPDTEECECEDIKGKLDGRPIVMSRYRLIKKILSPRHTMEVYLIECQLCGHLNATEILPERLRREMFSTGKSDLEVLGG